MMICEDCDIVFTAAVSYEAHINGKRHNKTVKLLAEEKDKQKHQAHVSWKKDVDKKQLEIFAMKYGPVKSVFVNKDNRYGIVEFNLPGSCSSFLSNDKYVLHDGVEISVNKRVSTKKRTLSTLLSNDANSSSMSTSGTNSHNANQSCDEISPKKSFEKKPRRHEPRFSEQNPKFLSKPSISCNERQCNAPQVSISGTIEVIDNAIEDGVKNMCKNEGFFRSIGFKCSNSLPLDALPQSPMSLANQRREQHIKTHGSHQSQQVKQQNKKPEHTPKKDSNAKKERGNNETDSILIKLISKQLMTSKSVDKQMLKLMNIVQLTKTDMVKRTNLANQIRNLASSLHGVRDAKVHMFGSSDNGMGIKGCDLDLILNVKSNMEVMKLLKLMKSRLYSCQDPKFKDIIVIPSKRCPIIRFYCPSLELKCDLSFNNSLALRNTNVLKFLGENVSEFRILCFVLRKWAGSVDVGGNIGGGPKLTHYALYMLVWFYVRAKFNLPSFEDLSNLQDEKEFIDQWDCSFPFDHPIRYTNSFSLHELLVGFFTFLKDVNFQDHVLCIRTGKIIPFDQLEKLEPFKKTALMVQDPFLLEHNITQNVTGIVLVRLQNALKEASSICGQSTFLSQTRVSNQDMPWGIIHLLTQKPPIDIIVSKSRPTKPRIFSFKINKPLEGLESLSEIESKMPRNSLENEESGNKSAFLNGGFVPSLVDKIASAVERVLNDVFLIKINSVVCCPLRPIDLHPQGTTSICTTTETSITPINITTSITTSAFLEKETESIFQSPRKDLNDSNEMVEGSLIQVKNDTGSPWKPWPNISSTCPKKSQRLSGSSLMLKTAYDDCADVQQSDELLTVHLNDVETSIENNGCSYADESLVEEKVNENLEDYNIGESDNQEIGELRGSDKCQSIEIENHILGGTEKLADDNFYREVESSFLAQLEDENGDCQAETSLEDDGCQPETSLEDDGCQPETSLEDEGCQAETSLEGYTLQFDCQSTLRTWHGRHKYRHHFSNVKDTIEREVLMTSKISDLQKGVDGVKECALPFDLKVIVRPCDAKSQTATFHVIPASSITRNLSAEFNSLMNNIYFVMQCALNSL